MWQNKRRPTKLHRNTTEKRKKGKSNVQHHQPKNSSKIGEVIDHYSEENHMLKKETMKSRRRNEISKTPIAIRKEWRCSEKKCKSIAQWPQANEHGHVKQAMYKIFGHFGISWDYLWNITSVSFSHSIALSSRNYSFLVQKNPSKDNLLVVIKFLNETTFCTNKLSRMYTPDLSPCNFHIEKCSASFEWSEDLTVNEMFPQIATGNYQTLNFKITAPVLIC